METSTLPSAIVPSAMFSSQNISIHNKVTNFIIFFTSHDLNPIFKEKIKKIYSNKKPTQFSSQK